MQFQRNGRLLRHKPKLQTPLFPSASRMFGLWATEWVFVAVLLVGGVCKVAAHQPPTRPASQTVVWEKSWTQEVQQFLAARRKRGNHIHPHAPLTKEWQEWNRLLFTLKRAIPHLSLATLQQARSVLENEGDLDRNRFFTFPKSLSQRIIRHIVAIDLRCGSYAQPRVPQPPAQRPVPSSTKPQDQDALPLGLGDALGSEESLSQMLQGGKKANIDESKLPPLVFTQQDLERFKTSRTLIAWPTARRRVGSGFGWRRDPFTRQLRFHKGIDIGSPFGSPVWAAAEGYVWRTGWFQACGLGVVIRHHRGMLTSYCHLSQILAPVGQWVQRGELIGRIGSTGRSTAPHLHFGLALQGKFVDPMIYLP